MKIKSIRIFIKHLRKFLAGFISVVIPSIPNNSSYKFTKQSDSLKSDFCEIDNDIFLAISKNKKATNN